MKGQSSSADFFNKKFNLEGGIGKYSVIISNQYSIFLFPEIWNTPKKLVILLLSIPFLT